MVVLGLGSNCGDQLSYLRKTIQKLKSSLVSPRIEVLAISPVYESDALLPAGAPISWDRNFLNVNVLCKTDLGPIDLLRHLKSIEALIGRQDRGRWAPREIDIDILAMDEQVFESESLRIPHPGLTDRPFAMLPFADLLPDWKFPQPGRFFERTASQIVSSWRMKAPEEMQFRTRRSHSCLTELVGILNITPDSFSDGGRFHDPKAALEQAHQLVSQGARVLDIGAESTRPGASPIHPIEEWKRLEPVLRELKIASASWSHPVALSIDTRHPETAARSIEAGANWINDVTGLSEKTMQRVLADSEVDVVIMHSLTVPPRKDAVLPSDEDPVSAILSWGEKRIQELTDQGISRERIILDPGFGFGKTIAQSWNLLREMRKLQELGVRILVGHSRKSFLSSLTDRPAADRDLETAALTLDLVGKGVDFLRVHQVEANARVLKVWAHVHGIIQCKP